jgi:uncharacterized protein (DUF1800 family)
MAESSSPHVRIMPRQRGLALAGMPSAVVAPSARVSVARVTRLAPIVLALAVLAPLPAFARDAASAPIGFDGARHLLVRTGFGATAAEIAAYAPLSREQAVDRLLAGVVPDPVTPVPDFLRETSLPPRPGASATPESRLAFVRGQARDTAALRAWWIGEMLATTSPLTERLTLFWHDHFASSQQKVRYAQLMYVQNRTFRRLAAGSFRTLLHAAAREPAMLVYLDGVRNRKGAPNENFAREVMELFTLGEGHYTEQDVKEAARAFSGWGIDPSTGTFRLRPRLHDDGEKVIFGHRGNFDGDDVLDLILAQPQAARFVVANLWREFVSPDPDPASVESIAARFRVHDYDLRVALRALLLSPPFWDAANRATLVRSPVELVVGTLHTLGLSPASALPFAQLTASMGENLFAPPNVKGWPGGEQWIDTNTLLARKQFLVRLARTRLVDDAAAATMQPSRIDDAAAAMMLPAPAERTASGATANDASLRDSTAMEAQARRARAARKVEATLARLAFDPVRWVQSLPGSDAPGRLFAAQRLLLPLAPVTADVAEARAERDPALLVRAALLDPVYQLK